MQTYSDREWFLDANCGGVVFEHRLPHGPVPNIGDLFDHEGITYRICYVAHPYRRCPNKQTNAVDVMVKACGTESGQL